MSYRSSTTLFLSISSIGLLLFSTFSETLLLSSLLWAVIQLFQSTIVELRSHNLTRTFQSRVILGHHSNFDSKWNHDQSAFFFTTNSSQVLNRSFVIFQESTISRFQDLFFLNFISFSQCLTVITSPSCKLFNCLISHFTVHTSLPSCVCLKFCHSTHDLIPNTSWGFCIFFQFLSVHSTFKTFHSLSICTSNMFQVHSWAILIVVFLQAYSLTFIWNFQFNLSHTIIQNIEISSSPVIGFKLWSKVRDKTWSVNIMLDISDHNDNDVEKILFTIAGQYLPFAIFCISFHVKLCKLFHVSFHITFPVHFRIHRNAILWA